METPPPLCGLLLAGGHGRRAGGPKALKSLDGRLLWRVHAEALHAAGCATVVAVLHPTAMPAVDASDAEAGPRWLRCVEADADAPMFASMQRGLAHIDAAAVLLQPVDAGRVDPATATALLSAAHPSAWIVRPRYGARTGHPLLLLPAACSALRSLDPRESRLDHWVAALHVERRRDVEVDDPAVLANYNADGTGAGGDARGGR